MSDTNLHVSVPHRDVFINNSERDEIPEDPMPSTPVHKSRGKISEPDFVVCTQLTPEKSSGTPVFKAGENNHEIGKEGLTVENNHEIGKEGLTVENNHEIGKEGLADRGYETMMDTSADATARADHSVSTKPADVQEAEEEVVMETQFTPPQSPSPGRSDGEGAGEMPDSPSQVLGLTPTCTPRNHTVSSLPRLQLSSGRNHADKIKAVKNHSNQAKQRAHVDSHPSEQRQPVVKSPRFFKSKRRSSSSATETEKDSASKGILKGKSNDKPNQKSFHNETEDISISESHLPVANNATSGNQNKAAGKRKLTMQPIYFYSSKKGKSTPKQAQFDPYALTFEDDRPTSLSKATDRRGGEESDVSEYSWFGQRRRTQKGEQRYPAGQSQRHPGQSRRQRMEAADGKVKPQEKPGKRGKRGKSAAAQPQTQQESVEERSRNTQKSGKTQATARQQKRANQRNRREKQREKSPDQSDNVELPQSPVASPVHSQPQLASPVQSVPQLASPVHSDCSVSLPRLDQITIEKYSCKTPVKIPEPAKVTRTAGGSKCNSARKTKKQRGSSSSGAKSRPTIDDCSASMDQPTLDLSGLFMEEDDEEMAVAADDEFISSPVLPAPSTRSRPASRKSSLPSPKTTAPVSKATASKAPVSRTTTPRAPVSRTTASRPPVSRTTASKAPVSRATAPRAPVSRTTPPRAPDHQENDECPTQVSVATSDGMDVSLSQPASQNLSMEGEEEAEEASGEEEWEAQENPAQSHLLSSLTTRLVSRAAETERHIKDLTKLHEKSVRGALDAILAKHKDAVRKSTSAISSSVNQELSRLCEEEKSCDQKMKKITEFVRNEIAESREMRRGQQESKSRISGIMRGSMEGVLAADHTLLSDLQTVQDKMREERIKFRNSVIRDMQQREMKVIRRNVQMQLASLLM